MKTGKNLVVSVKEKSSSLSDFYVVDYSTSGSTPFDLKIEEAILQRGWGNAKVFPDKKSALWVSESLGLSIEEINIV